MAMADVLPSVLPLMEGLRADDPRPRHLTAVRGPRPPQTPPLRLTT